MTERPVQGEFWQVEPEGDFWPKRRTLAEIAAEGVTAAVVKELLRLRHAEPVGAWAYFDEFIPGIGYSSPGVDTRIDAWAMAVWPSSGYRTVAYEIKVSRSDFLRELKDPSKREWAMKYSDEFYFVTPAYMIERAELPANCGLIEVTRVAAKGTYHLNGQLFNVRAKVKPPRRNDWKYDRRLGEPENRPSWHLLAAVARRAARAQAEAFKDPVDVAAQSQEPINEQPASN